MASPASAASAWRPRYLDGRKPSSRAADAFSSRGRERLKQLFGVAGRPLRDDHPEHEDAERGGHSGGL